MSLLKALPVCGYHPPGQCVVIQPDCTYPPNTPFCPVPAAHSVPTTNDIALALMVLLVVIIAAFAVHGSKR